MIHMVVAFRLKEKMAGLPCSHRYQPCNQCGHGGVDEQVSIRQHKAHGADEMQRLIDSAVVVITVVIPALNFKLFKKFRHGYSSPLKNVNQPKRY